MMPKKRKVEDVEVEEIPQVSVKDRPNIDALQEMVSSRPYAIQQIQMQLLYDLCSLTEENMEQTRDLKEAIRSQIPEGKVFPRELTITEEIFEFDSKREVTLPWRVVEIVNYGPDKLYVEVNKNTMSDTAPLVIGESLSVDTKTLKIAKILLRSSGTSRVRLYGQR